MENGWINKKNGRIILLAILICLVGKLFTHPDCTKGKESITISVTPESNPKSNYDPPYDPRIRYMHRDLKEMIDCYAGDYYNKQWKVSLSQYKAWIAQITLMETSNLRYAAHSGYALGNETFYHITVGKKFPFSTSVGIFQLNRGGPNGKDNWDKMSTIDKINPGKSLASVLNWHKNRFAKKATLADFWKASRWYAVRNKAFEKHWQLTTDKTWGECKDVKIEVSFHPPITNVSPCQEAVKCIGKAYWNLPGWQDYFKTWLISAKTYQGRKIYSYSYYYSKNNDTGWEMWVWNSEGLVHRHARRYVTTHLPENIDKTTGQYAGFTDLKPALDLNNLRH